MEIRPATPDDLEGVIASSAALFAEDAASRDKLRNSAWPAEHGAKWVRELMADPQALLLIAAVDGEVVGHLVGAFEEPSYMWIVSRAELVSMYVRTELRGRGIGGGLIDAFIAWARDRGAVRLHVSAYAANEGAVRLYRSHGFEPLSINLASDL